MPERNALRVAFIGFGEAARAFVDSLQANAALSFTAYDILQESPGRSDDFAAAAAQRNVMLAANHADAARDADWVFSAVTAASSLEAAESTLAGLHAGQVFFDINSVSPARKRQTADRLASTGAIYIDMAVMAPAQTGGHGTPTLVAGAIPPGTLDDLKRLDFQFQQVSNAPGDATAIKMVRSLFVKGLEAITTQALLAARIAGCQDHVVKSVAKSFPGLGWPDSANYQLERVATHGVRRAAEMRECAAFLDEIGVGGQLSRAIADVQNRVGELGLSAEEKDGAVILDAIGRRLDGAS